MKAKERTLLATIRNTYERCKEENIGISMNHLRFICKNGLLPTCKIGKKYLINWNNLMNYVNGECFQEKEVVILDDYKDMTGKDKIRPLV
ncbi:MAG: hypothetical protein IJ583_04200 [Firmicutes bacterium]|nr:hypothetical protein [Bacillota bacterium]